MDTVHVWNMVLIVAVIVVLGATAVALMHLVVAERQLRGFQVFAALVFAGIAVVACLALLRLF